MGALGEHERHEKATVGTAGDAKMFWPGDFAGVEVFSDGDEVVAGALAVHLALKRSPPSV
jgi:hypothetical protein